MTNGCEEESSVSRFSQFFRRESPSPQQTSGFPQENKTAPNDVFGTVVTGVYRYFAPSRYQHVW